MPPLSYAFCSLAPLLVAVASAGGAEPGTPAAEPGTPAAEPGTPVAASGGAETDGPTAGGSGCGCGALKRSDFKAGPPTEEAQQCASEEGRGVEDASHGETEEEASVIWLEGGNFIMGIVPGDERGNQTIMAMDYEGPSRTEVVAPFGLGAYEVSNGRFARFVERTGYVTESEKFGWSFAVEAFLSPEVNANITQQVLAAPWWLPVEGADWRHPHGRDTSVDGILEHPVTQVSLADAQAFCAWSRPGGRLPTEEEWEFAARGGREQLRFPWGNKARSGKRKRHRMNVWQSKLDAKLRKDGRVISLYDYGEEAIGLVKEFYSSENTALDGYRATAPVDAYGPQNALGFHNMVGNVWEWTSTQWQRKDPRGPPVEPNSMVKKGGSFLCNPATCNRFRCSARMLFTADSAASNVGFRCAYSK